MQAIVLEQPEVLKKIELEAPQPPAPNDVLLKMKRLGVCGTDLHAYKGNQPFFSYPRILGHEIAAEVIALGENVSHLKIGDRCAVMPYRNKEIDQAVRRGKTNCGSTLSVLGVHEDGAMQEYISYPAQHVFPANELSLDQIAMIEPLAIGSHAVERADIQPDDIVLVVGAGPIGIGTVAMALLKAAKVLVLDMNQNRLDYIAEKFPSVSCIKLSDVVENSLKELLNGDLPTVILDATGNKESMQKCFEYVAQGGTIVYIGLFIGDVVFHDPLFHRKEITLKSSRNAVATDFTKLIRLLKAGLVNIDGYITHRLAFDTLHETFTKLYSPEERVIKAVVEFD
ncbi:alcohol dehydrogenase catalytic domain-containing protein [Runella sp. CRIBMP]|uniref:zinc-binding alcohol dehydrogenase family protein n=1 Tax=Runella sp. CRIBMP TaxID=2683261 RepID=UPI0014135FCF|nr:zinc-binding alcohol dehydrogenase family protein [Runella sp. CRIBMP]NBB23174.1 alcohol dehydrogenase catalytic domain-containing protein [Runella sp. CRIBMP]